MRRASFENQSDQLLAFSPVIGVVMKCPICKQEVSWEGNSNRPFCSERCRLIDLGKWANGNYALPAAEETTEETGKEEQNVET